MESSTPKISSGICKGLKLKVKKGLQTRPTPSRVREAVMNHLQYEIEGCIFTDLYAGSGAMGIDAMSRGAAHVTWVESDTQAGKILKENVSNALRRFEQQDLEAPETDILISTVIPVYTRLTAADIVWVDAPWDHTYDQLKSAGTHVFESVKSGGMLVVEKRKGVEIDFIPWEKVWSRSYGEAEVLIWRKP